MLHQMLFQEAEMRRPAVFFAILLAVLMMVSCSGGGGNILAPKDEAAVPIADAVGSTACLGLWQAVASPESGTLEITAVRESEYMLNVIGFLEPPALVNLQIDFSTLFIDFDTDEIFVDVILKHPLNSPTFKGFDVKGVVFGPKLANADGYTPVMNPDIFSGVPFGYSDGLLGAPNSVANFDNEISGYKYFCDGLGLNEDLAEFFTDPDNLDNRGVFPDGGVLRRHYDLAWEGSGYDLLVFNYAVYANYDWPIGDLPVDLDDFSISTANSAEAFCGKITEISNSLYYQSSGGGGAISLEAEIWDWQNNIESVSIRSLIPGIIDETPGVLVGPGSTSHSNIYSFNNTPGTPTGSGDIDIVITAYDPETFAEAWFLGMLPTYNPLYDENVYNCFIHTAYVADCPPANITSVQPDDGWAGQMLALTISGNFIDGAYLGVRLEHAGESDIVATNVVFVNANTITCDIDLDGAVGGNWDVVVTNGCGTDGTLTAGFTVNDCAGQSECPSGAFNYANHQGPFIHYNFRGTAATRASSTQYLICTGYKSTIRYRVFAYVPGATDYAYMTEQIEEDGLLPYDIAIDSSDRVYYYCGLARTEVRYVDFLGDGFGTYGQPFGIPVPWGDIHRLSVDPDDNPVVLCRTISGSQELRIYHWNGTDWGSAVYVPSTVLSDNGGNYTYINDFEVNPVTGDYLITTYYNPPKFYAVDDTGTIVYSDDDIWETGVTPDGIYSGIYIDHDSPDCRFLFNGAPWVYINGPHVGVAHFARCNPVYGEWTYATTPSGDYPFSDGRGSVVWVNGTPYFCGTSSYRWYSTYIEVPDW